MGLMTTARTMLPGGPWTVDDLDDFPEGSTTRYELIDGALIVSSEPSLQHQRVNLLLARLLQDHVPEGFEVFLPVDVRLSPFRQIAPDVTVVRREDATGRRLSGLPVLVVEVQSPSTRAIDLALKRQVLQEAGVPSYWLVDPDDGVVTVLELQDGVYVEVARGTSVTVQQPFPITVTLG